MRTDRGRDWRSPRGRRPRDASPDGLRDRPVAQGLRAYGHPQRHPERGDGLDVHRGRCVQDVVGVRRVGDHHLHCGSHHRHGAVEVLAVRDRDVDGGDGPALAAVADAHDRAVGDVPDHAVVVPDPGHAQADLLDGADGLAGVDDVTDAVLVLQDHEDAGEEVLDQALRAEADGDADDTRAGQDGSDVDAERGERRDDGEGEDDERRDALEQPADGARPLTQPFDRLPRRSSRSSSRPWCGRICGRARCR